MLSTGKERVKEGYVKKRSGRLQRWTHRYFSLSGSKLSYRLKGDPVSPSNPLRGEYDLVPGCLVTEVVEDSNSMSIQGKKLFSFWIVWPHDKGKKGGSGGEASDKVSGPGAAEEVDIWSDASNEIPLPGHSPPPASSSLQATTQPGGSAHKDLKEIVRSEMESRNMLKSKTEQQVKSHRAHDSNVSLGAKVAAVAVGGAVVGALTAGVGLIPYLTIVGIATVAGGGAVVLQYKKPKDSRLILAYENVEEALSWRNSIMQEISRLDKSGRPLIPAVVDTEQIVDMLSTSSEAGLWRCVSVYEGMRVMQRKDLDDDTFSFVGETKGGVDRGGGGRGKSGIGAKFSICRKAQLVFQTTPIAAFISLMENQHWPRGGSFLIDRAADDHADFITALASSHCVENDTGAKQFGYGYHGATAPNQVKMSLGRFWRLDDEGTYLITLSSVAEGSIATDAKQKAGNSNSSSSSSSSSSGGDVPDGNCDLSAVISIAPRKDHGEYDDDVRICLVSIVVQMNFNCNPNSSGGGSNSDKSDRKSKGSRSYMWTASEANRFMDDFIRQHTVDVHQFLEDKKYAVPSLSSSSSSSSLSSSNIYMPLENDKYPLKSEGSNSSLSIGTPTSRSNSSDQANNPLIALANQRSNPDIDKKRKEGRVTSVQPGLEDATQDSYNRKAASTLKSDMDPISGQKKTFFSFNRSNSSNSSSNINGSTSSSSVSGGGNGNIADRGVILDASSKLAPKTTASKTSSSSSSSFDSSSNLFKMTGSGSKFSFRRRSTNANPDLVRLRGQIAAKEYEIQRMEAIMKRLNKEATSAGGGPGLVGGGVGGGVGGSRQDQDKVDLLTFQNSIKELQNLKRQHFEISGVEYDHHYATYGGDGSNNSSNNSSRSGGGGDSSSFSLPRQLGSDSSVQLNDNTSNKPFHHHQSRRGGNGKGPSSSSDRSDHFPSHWMIAGDKSISVSVRDLHKSGKESRSNGLTSPLVKAVLIVLLSACLTLSAVLFSSSAAGV